MDPMTPSPDSSSELDLIKQSLMKVIDQMNQMESQRLLPDGHPLKAAAPTADASGVDKSGPAEGGISADEPADDGSGGELDSGVLSQLMDKASSVDDTGASPEDDAESTLPPDLMAAVSNKKKKPVI